MPIVGLFFGFYKWAQIGNEYENQVSEALLIIMIIIWYVTYIIYLYSLSTLLLSSHAQQVLNLYWLLLYWMCVWSISCLFPPLYITFLSFVLYVANLFNHVNAVHIPLEQESSPWFSMFRCNKHCRCKMKPYTLCVLFNFIASLYGPLFARACM